jgi:HAE1 family hydrophobic/amphiphilic exporter-1
MPLALGWGVGADLQAALARVVIGGLLASTLITLVLIPTLYLSANHGLERVRGWTARRLGRESGMPEPAN